MFREDENNQCNRGSSCREKDPPEADKSSTTSAFVRSNPGPHPEAPKRSPYALSPGSIIPTPRLGPRPLAVGPRSGWGPEGREVFKGSP